MNPIERLEQELSELGDELDPGDIFGILLTIHRSSFSSLSFSKWLDDSSLAREIIHQTQSNPQLSLQILRQMGDIDDRIADL